MKPFCPRCEARCSVKYGRYHRNDDAQFIQRYRCKACGKCHSSATHVPTYRQKRRRLNRLILKAKLTLPLNNPACQKYTDGHERDTDPFLNVNRGLYRSE